MMLIVVKAMMKMNDKVEKDEEESMIKDSL